MRASRAASGRGAAACGSLAGRARNADASMLAAHLSYPPLIRRSPPQQGKGVPRKSNFAVGTARRPLGLHGEVTFALREEVCLPRAVASLC